MVDIHGNAPVFLSILAFMYTVRITYKKNRQKNRHSQFDV